MNARKPAAPRKPRPAAARAGRLVRRADGYDKVLADMVHLLEAARRGSARMVNAIMTATYWEIGRRIVQYEQGGRERAAYGEMLMKRLAEDLTSRFGRGFGFSNLKQMRKFFLTFPPDRKGQTVSGPSGRGKHAPKSRTASGQSALAAAAARFPLPWSHYVRLLSLENSTARRFYETEALRGGWSVRQLDRQIDSQFYERTALSRNKAAMLMKGGRSRAGDAVTPEEEIKDPYVLEFLGLRYGYFLASHLPRDVAFLATRLNLECSRPPGAGAPRLANVPFRV